MTRKTIATEPKPIFIRKPLLGDKKWNGELYTEEDIALLRSGENNIKESFNDLINMIRNGNTTK